MTSKTKTKQIKKHPLLFLTTFSFMVAWRYIWINYPLWMPAKETSGHKKTNLTLLSSRIFLSMQGQDENRFLSLTTSKALVSPLETELLPGRWPVVDVYSTELLPGYGSLHPELHTTCKTEPYVCEATWIYPLPRVLRAMLNDSNGKRGKKQAWVIFCAIPTLVILLVKNISVVVLPTPDPLFNFTAYFRD